MAGTRRIERLTPEQEAELPAFRAEWLRKGLRTGPCDHARVEEGVAEVYRAIGKEPPGVVIWMSSPLGGAFAAALLSDGKDQIWGQLGDQLRDQLRGQLRGQLSRCFWGQHDIGAFAFYEFVRQIGGVLDDRLTRGFDGWLKLCEAGWWWPYEGFVVLTEPPDTLHRDDQGRLHSESGPATSYADGWGVWAVHGVRVAREVVESPETITPDAIFAEGNVEVRRVMVDLYGWDRLVDVAGLTLVDEQPDPANAPHTIRLYDVPEKLYGSPVRVALVTNASCERDGTRRRYGLTVPADIDDAVAAIAWTGNVTAKQYRALARAT